MSNGTLEPTNKCDTCVHSEDEYYADGEFLREAFDVANCGMCIHSSSAENNYERKESKR